ncbi:MAG: 3-deoxy-manno-octulosonate cytidylyltransferase [Gammaproteobacteria bacterium]
MQVVIVIPARFGSSRLPGKPLIDILGKPMIQHVVERAHKVRTAQHVVVATDDDRILQAVRAFGGEALLTSRDHASGTDRLVEVMTTVPSDIYVNIQGDEPLVRPEDIEVLIAGMLADESVAVGTLCHSLPAAEASNPNAVKVVLATNGDALYFSRAPIPYPRDHDGKATYLKHVGVYAYRRAVLEQYARLPQPMLERAEKLEQLRLLHAGFRIRVFPVAPTGPGVDTPECLARVRALMSDQPQPVKATLANVRLVITDVDGVLTDATLVYSETGEHIKVFHARDGLGMRLLEMCGIQVGVVSGRDSAALRKRLADLKIELQALGVKDKRTACQELMAKASVSPEETAFVGDDTMDLSAFEACGMAVAVANAPEYIRAAADIVLATAGGAGAFRELADRILVARGRGNVLSRAADYEALEGYKVQ